MTNLKVEIRSRIIVNDKVNWWIFYKKSRIIYNKFNDNLKLITNQFLNENFVHQIGRYIPKNIEDLSDIIDMYTMNFLIGYLIINNYVHDQ